jgi:ABC-type lipoprotein export system ATPase subunit
VTDALLEGRHLRKVHRRGAETIVAVDDLSIELRPGELVVIQGPSGSGKTSLLDLLTGFDSPDAGEVLWRGRAVDPSTLGWADLAVVPQRRTLLDELTVAENATLPLRLAGRGADGVEALLDELGLGALGARRPGELSQGQAQRAEVARALAIEPALVVADEPSSSQNEALARTVFGALRVHADGGRTALVASHDPVAAEYADRIVSLRDGSTAAGQP